uniref:Uncharacterized protein n=1 Tax=Scleropages formosus TaxID=113540 RepID=A0A8C9UZP6_SCLFO
MKLKAITNMIPSTQCLLATVKHVGGCIMAWVAISWKSLSPVIALLACITAKEYAEILGVQVHPMVQIHSSK